MCGDVGGDGEVVMVVRIKAWECTFARPGSRCATKKSRHTDLMQEVY